MIFFYIGIIRLKKKVLQFTIVSTYIKQSAKFSIVIFFFLISHLILYCCHKKFFFVSNIKK